MSIILKLIIAYFIIGLLVMWFVENVLYKVTIKKGAMTKALSEYYEHLFSLPLSHQFIIFGLCWPIYFPKLISTVIKVLF